MTTANTKLTGWVPVPLREPEWWSTASTVASPVAPPVTTTDPVIDADGQGVLFVDSQPERSLVSLDAWVDEVLASPVMADQRRIAGRQALNEASIRVFLTMLHASGGVASPAILADTLNLPPSRLRTKLEALRRMLNVDGYAVLTIEPDGTVKLNLDLLRTQFEVER